MKRVDIVMVGGGPAGGMMAWSAARAGFSVILLEAGAVLPERVCGAYLCPAGVRLLAELGLLERLTAGCRELLGMIMVSPEGRRVQAGFPADGGAITHGLALDRPGFDRRWLELARGAGAEVRMGARVMRMHHAAGDGAWRVGTADGREIHAELLVGADGRKSFVARHLGVLQAPKRIRAAAHLDVAPLQPLPPFGQMHVFADGSYAGLNPLASDRVNVSFVCHPEALRDHGAAEWLNSRLRGTLLGEQIPVLDSNAKFGITFPATSSVSAVATGNAALIGDASGFIDPLTGEGIYNALWTAQALAAALEKNRGNLSAALRQYTGIRWRTQWAKAALSHVFQGVIRRPVMANSVLRLLARRQGVADAFIGIIGNTHSPARGFAKMIREALRSRSDGDAHGSSPHPRMSAHINHIACASPLNNQQAAFLESLPHWVGPPAIVEKLRQVAANSGIRSRHSVLESPFGPPGSGAFYSYGQFPGTQARMEAYRRYAPPLAFEAVRRLQAEAGPAAAQPTHLIVTSCTGFYAPSLDIDIVREFSFSPTVKRTLIGFMGCHAGLVGLRTASDIVNADPAATVMVVNLELCSLHLQQTLLMDRLISFLLFADGAAASLVTSKPEGLRIDGAWSHASLEDSERMAWNIEDSGFAMTLDARLPIRIRQFLSRHAEYGSPATTGPADPETLWAVHPGGRLILDSVQDAFGLSDARMAPSRRVLREYGNMSSASVLFSLREHLLAADAVSRPGRALAFGPGLTIEGVNFTKIPKPVRIKARPARQESAVEITA
ncbi:MAG: alpha-pyrone synthesis polyketide synthase-like Pks18 [Verrucomicrobiales bacterium]|nr:alpha-pyrone synthesis polyketide synthase-like Pks18 [Verrucomicrobiales bacterium]